MMERTASQILNLPLLCGLALCLAAVTVPAATRYAASGLVVSVDPSSRTMVVSCERIPGLMDAMVMPFLIRDAKELTGLAPGTMVDFTLVVEKESSHAESVRIRHFTSPAQETVQQQRLEALQKVLQPHVSATALRPGELVPDFTLTDQTGSKISLHQFAGKVVLLDFIYTRCVLPDYCYRFSNQFGTLQRRFADRLGKDVVEMTITFDPVHDQPDVLANYARTWKANPKTWHFLTGSPDDVQRVCSWFGIESWASEGLLVHTLHTAIIDRDGILAANLEGNQFTAQQLGDLAETIMERPAK
jgi:protein SCO1/2